MLEDIIENVVRPAAVYGMVNVTAGIFCIRETVKEMPAIGWKKQTEIGIERFKYMFQTSHYQIISFGYFGAYYLLQLSGK